MNTPTFIQMAPAKLLAILWSSFNNSAQSNQTIDIANIPAGTPPKVKKGIAALKKLVKDDGLAAGLPANATCMTIVNGKVSTYVLCANVTMADYNNASVDYFISGEALISKQFAFLGSYQYLHIAVEPDLLEIPYIVGNTPLLGNWNDQKALPLTFVPSRIAAYQIDIPFLPGQHLEFKFLTKRPDGISQWESGDNWVLTAGGEDISWRNKFRP